MPNVVVHAHEAYSGVDLTEEPTWGGTPDTYLGLAILGETLHTEYTVDPVSEEIGAFGGVKTAGYRSKKVTGDIRWEPRLDSKATHLLLGNMFCEEKLLQDVWVDNSAAVNVNTHCYLFNATRGNLNVRSHKSGKNTSGSGSVFAGLKCAGFQMSMPTNGIPFMTAKFLGKSETKFAESGNEIVAPLGTRVSTGRMLSNPYAVFKTDTGLSYTLKVMGFTIDVNLPLESDEAYLNDPTEVLEPGLSGNRTVTVNIDTQVSQGYFADGTPYDEFIDANFSSCNIILTTADNIITAKPYAMRWHFPSIMWTKAEAPINNKGALKQTLSFQAIEAATASPNTGLTDVRCLVAVAGTAGGDDLDTYFTSRITHS